MPLAKTVAAIKRNALLLGEIKEASEFRITYKTKSGWKRLDKLVPATVDAAVDKAVETLVELLNA